MKDTIKARRLVLVDGKGEPRIVLDASWPDGFASIDLLGHSGAALKLWVDKDGSPKVAVQRKNSRFAITFAITDADEPRVTFYGRDGKPMFRIGRNENSAAASIDIFKGGELHWSSSGARKRPGKKAAKRKKAE
jgi:hypothetical protein